MRECMTHRHACDCRERLFARALEIADEAMTRLLYAHAVNIDTGEASADEQLPEMAKFGLVNEAQEEVSHLADADPAIVEAFEWLSQRCLAELLSDRHGEFIRLVTPSTSFTGASREAGASRGSDSYTSTKENP